MNSMTQWTTKLSSKVTSKLREWIPVPGWWRGTQSRTSQENDEHKRTKFVSEKVNKQFSCYLSTKKQTLDQLWDLQGQQWTKSELLRTESEWMPVGDVESRTSQENDEHKRTKLVSEKVNKQFYCYLSTKKQTLDQLWELQGQQWTKSELLRTKSEWIPLAGWWRGKEPRTSQENNEHKILSF